MEFKFRNKDYRPFITLGEIMTQQHPELFKAFMYHIDRDVTEIAMAAAQLTWEEKKVARVMQERPMPGCGGDV